MKHESHERRRKTRKRDFVIFAPFRAFRVPESPPIEIATSHASRPPADRPPRWSRDRITEDTEGSDYTEKLQ